MTPVQIVSVVVIVAFVVLLAAGSRYRPQRRQPRPIREPATPPGGSAAVAGDHRAGGERFRADALAAADDPIGSHKTERNRA